MKRFRTSIFALATLLLASCAAQKQIWYIQDAEASVPETIIQDAQRRIMPHDRLSIIITSKDPELAVPLNSASSFSSLVGPSFANASSSQSLQFFTVDENGVLELPLIGPIYCKDKTRYELSREIADKVIAGGYINDPQVNVQFTDMRVAVIGEVFRPGTYDISRDRVSILDALAMAGDLTLYGIRTEVAVIREADGKRTVEYVDLTSKDLFNSPAYYLQQNDVVYVKPNKYKAQASEINQNRGFYISLASTIVSLATLVITITSIK